MLLGFNACVRAFPRLWLGGRQGVGLISLFLGVKTNRGRWTVLLSTTIEGWWELPIPSLRWLPQSRW